MKVFHDEFGAQLARFRRFRWIRFLKFGNTFFVTAGASGVGSSLIACVFFATTFTICCCLP